MITRTRIVDRGEWLMARAPYIGSSEIGQVAGVSPWGDARDVYLAKLRAIAGDYGQPPASGPMLRGLDLEELVWQKTYGSNAGERDMLYVDAEHGMAATPDRVTYGADGSVVIHEIKCVGRSTAARIAEDGISEDYLLQAQHQIALVSQYLLQLHPPGASPGLSFEFIIFDVDSWSQPMRIGVLPDPALQARCRELSMWLRQCVLDRTPPPEPPRRRPRPRSSSVQLEAGDERETLAVRYLAAREAAQAADLLVAELRAELLERCAPGRYESEAVRVTVYDQPGRTTLNERALEDYGALDPWLLQDYLLAGGHDIGQQTVGRLLGEVRRSCRLDLDQFRRTGDASPALRVTPIEEEAIHEQQ